MKMLVKRLKGFLKNENSPAFKTRQTEEGRFSVGNNIRSASRNIFNKRKSGFLENSTCPCVLFPDFIT